MTEVYLTLWEKARADGNQAEARTLKAATRKACKALRQYAVQGRYPIGRPRAWLYRGWFEWLSGRTGRARRLWRKSLAYAQDVDMAYEEGLAHYEIGRHLRGSDPAWQEDMAKAAEIFTRLGAAYDLERVKAQTET
jgi:hypothetical protein